MALLVPGSTCWKIARAARLALIQDAGPCFSHVAEAFTGAVRSIFILGWDLDSRTVLRPEADEESERVLLPLLLRCLQRRPELEIFILTWDFSFVYSFEREPAPRGQFGSVHPRLHFALDADHGSGGSHHQKVIVVDDEVAFVGGIDLTFHRWDLPAHLPFDPRRLDADGQHYGPFHDVHAAVSGPAAAALGELARMRWNVRRRAPPPDLAAAPSGDALAWPRHLPIDAVDIEVGLARTFTQAGQPHVREIEALTLQAIASAGRMIFAENQYLTSQAVVRALAARLSEPEGPEVVMVLPRSESGWMEQSSMGLLRQEALRYLERSDSHQRLRLLSPVVVDGETEVPIAVHSKVMIVDDGLAKIGSANFSNRSMGLDSECDLAIEATDDASRRFVSSVRDRLLAEHLGLSPAEVAARLTELGSLRGLVDQARSDGGARRLVPVPLDCNAPVDLTLFDGAFVDPPEPWNVDMLLRRAIPLPLRPRLARRWLWPILLATILMGIWGTVRHFDPHGMHLRSLVKEGATFIAEQPGGAVAATIVIMIGGMMFIPITILATTALTVFGLWPGIAVAWSGAVLSAVGSHAVGGRLGSKAVGWLSPRSQVGLRRFLGRRGFWSVILIRLLPVGNFGALNLLAGAVGVPRRAFILGNMVGLLPGLLGLGLFVNRAIEAVRNPSVVNVVAAAAIVGAGTVLGVLLKRRFDRSAGRRERRADG
jgi:phospholipase D1/2